MKSFTVKVAIVSLFIASGFLSRAAGLPQFLWSRSLPIAYMSPSINPIGGTELREMATMGGRLYAGNGYWRDAEENNPNLPGAQVLVLDSPGSNWRVDLQLNAKIPTGPNAGQRRYWAIGSLSSFQFSSDGNGQKFSAPFPILFASVWDRIGGLSVFSKTQTTSWTETQLVPNAPPRSQIRSFGFYKDKTTGLERVFAGTNPYGIFSGTLDGSTNGFIQWGGVEPLNSPPSQGKTDRVMGFSECGGKFYASIGWDIYERQDGLKPWWKKVYEHPPGSPNSSGLRGITTITDPSGRYQALLVAVEDNPLTIFRVEPFAGFRAALEINVSQFLTQAWGTPVTYGIAGYNNMTIYPDFSGGHCPSVLIGFEATTPQAANGLGRTRKNPGGHYLVRDCRGSYAVHAIVDPRVNPPPSLESTRTIILSPFTTDPVGTIYAGGFDAGNIIPHNTAWVYRGVP